MTDVKHASGSGTTAPEITQIQQQNFIPRLTFLPAASPRGSAATSQMIPRDKGSMQISVTHKTVSPAPASVGPAAPGTTLCGKYKSCVSWEPNYHLQNSFAIRLKL